jgi:hypothetical protein
VGDDSATADAITAVLEREWDRSRISSALGVGSWRAVGSQVVDHMAELLESCRGASRGSG